MGEFLDRLDDALDDLPRYMAVTQPEGGWLPGDPAQPTMRACVYVDDVREMLRRQTGFAGLVRMAQAMLDERYPADVFGSGPLSLDAGARFTNKLREALGEVHAGSTGGESA